MQSTIKRRRTLTIIEGKRKLFISEYLLVYDFRKIGQPKQVIFISFINDTMSKLLNNMIVQFKVQNIIHGATP